MAAPTAGGSPVDDAGRTTIGLFDGLPLLFVLEQVPPDDAVAFAVRGSEASVWLTARGLRYRLHPAGRPEHAAAGSWVVALDLVDAAPREPLGEHPLPTRVSYFKGPKAGWRTGLPAYGSVVYREPWPGVDLVVSGAAGQLESTFVVRPGADPGAIRLAYRGASAVRLTAKGGLTVETPLGPIAEAAPFAYQEVEGRRVEVAATFELEEGGGPHRQAYRFRLGPYDPSRELVVDPVALVYLGFIGGSALDSGHGVAVDTVGNAHVVGMTTSTAATFPVTVGPDPTFNGGELDVFVARVNATGTALDFCGYIGGSGADIGHAIAVDAAGNTYVTGATSSTEETFPVTVGPDLTYNGGESDAFVARINASGTALDSCGYIGGSGEDRAYGIVVNAAARVSVTGVTASTEATFPVTVGPDLTYNGGHYDAFVATLNATDTALDSCGYVGGSGSEEGSGIALDSSGNVFVTGHTTSGEATFPVRVGPDLTHNGDSDAFVAMVDAAGTTLVYCGYIGGGGADWGYGIAVDATGHAYVTGQTYSAEATFPVTVGPDLTANGDSDAFVAKVNAAGTGLEYCGYIGGARTDWGYGIAVDAAGATWVSGTTSSTETTFPVLGGPDLTHNGGRYDAFVAEVRTDGAALDSCGYVGGSARDRGWGIAVDAAGSAYLAGATGSSEATFPVAIGPDLTANGGGDAFVAKVGAFDGIFVDGVEAGTTSAWSVTQP